jgi:ElaB/YqjD/DUF883 family membrane-anchored ribosome-binding protein
VTEVSTEELSERRGVREGAGAPEQERLVRQIEETRAELGDTLDALAQRADVKARLSGELEQRKAAWRERLSSATPEDAKRAGSQLARTAEERPWPAIAVALALGLLFGRMLGRR